MVPQAEAAAKHLETWMTVTAAGAVDTLLSSGFMDGAARLLDMGGGDGAIALVVMDAHR